MVLLGLQDGWMLSRKPKVSVPEENNQRSETFTNINNYLLNSKKTPALLLMTKQKGYKRGQVEKSIELLPSFQMPALILKNL